MRWANNWAQTSEGSLPVRIHRGVGESARVKRKDDILLQIFENDIIADDTDIIYYLGHQRLDVTRWGRHFLPTKQKRERENSIQMNPFKGK